MLDPRETVARLVLDHPECAPVFARKGIDYCCRGNVSLESACADRGLDTASMVEALEGAIAREGGRGADRRAMSTEALVEQIVARHHGYLRDTLPVATALAAKVDRVHVDRDRRLGPLHAAVRELSAALLPHLDEEESKLFPAMLAAAPDQTALAHGLDAMLTEHRAVGELLESIRTLTGDFTVPAWACTSYRTLFSMLERLEADTLEHVHLENHVLLPRFATA